MSNRRMSRVVLVATGACAALSFAVPPAGAAPHPHLCGALNMIEASPSYYGPNAVSDGMDIAMSHDNANGNTGMFGAVAATCPPAG